MILFAGSFLLGLLSFWFLFLLCFLFLHEVVQSVVNRALAVERLFDFVDLRLLHFRLLQLCLDGLLSLLLNLLLEGFLELKKLGMGPAFFI